MIFPWATARWGQWPCSGCIFVCKCVYVCVCMCVHAGPNRVVDEAQISTGPERGDPLTLRVDTGEVAGCGWVGWGGACAGGDVLFVMFACLSI